MKFVNQAREQSLKFVHRVFEKNPQVSLIGCKVNKCKIRHLVEINTAKFINQLKGKKYQKLPFSYQKIRQSIVGKKIRNFSVGRFKIL